MKKITVITVIALAFVFASQQKVHAQIPRTISFQGVLADAQGNLVPDGNHQLQIVLYDQATNGNQVFVENQTVPVVKGIFNVIIGSVAVIPQSLSFDRAYFLGVSVDGGSELTPRTALTSVPYALRAERANIAESLSPNAAVVTHVNNESGDVTLLGAGGTTVTNNGNAFTISSTGTGGTGIQGVQSTDGTIAIQNPNGPVATLGIANGSVTPEKINSTGAGSGQALMYNGSSVQWITPSGGGSGVSSINNANGALTLAASGGATVSTNGKTITINAGSGSGGTGIQGIQNTDNTLDIANPGGPTATINVKNQGITTTKLADGSVTNAKIPTGQVVKSINALKDDVTLAAGSNVTITPNGNTLTIATSGGGGTSPWATNGNNISNTNTSNVGIGTSNPAVKLDVNGSLNANSGATITGTNGDGAVITARSSIPGADPYVIIDASTESGNSVLAYRKNNLNRWLMFADNAGSNFRLDAYNDAGNGIATRLFVDRATGNVGIGTIAPQAKLHVETSGTNHGIYGHTNGSGVGVTGYSSNDGDGVHGQTSSSSAFGVKCIGNGCYTNSWTNCSDLRMKKDIVPLNDALSNLLQLRGVYYYWRKSEFPDENFFSSRQIGVIAQEVEPLYPELVVTDSKGYKSVDYTKLTPILLEAIKEQQKTIDTLTKSNQTFNERLTQLEKRIGLANVQTSITSLDINK